MADEFLEALKSPEIYPHPTDEIIIRETHISIVILTGSQVYKIKKPVKFPFVDYTTLQKRKEYCELELKLNRRFAPELYLDVIPISGDRKNPRFDDNSAPFEYAVVMNQFTEEGLLNNIIKRGELSVEQVEQMAKAIADFHETAGQVDFNTLWGRPESVKHVASENIRILKSSGIVDKRLESLSKWTETSFQKLSKVFEQRRSQGMVRECHGDLHLGNIVLLGDQVCLFDGIEFNEEFRWIDVISDVAFLMMDFMDHGRDDLGFRLINKYLEYSGDYHGLQILNWYLTYRALVRAKVSALRMKQLSGDDRIEQEKELEKYTALAERYTIQRPPALFITHGLSGSGKTTETNLLIEKCGVIRIRSDVERKRLIGLQPEEASKSGPGENAYTRDMSKMTYEILRDLADKILSFGFSVIVDATFLSTAMREMFYTLAGERGLSCHLLSFEAQKVELEKRILRRQKESKDASEATIEVLNAQIEYQDELSERDEKHKKSVNQAIEILKRS